MCGASATEEPTKLPKETSPTSHSYLLAAAIVGATIVVLTCAVYFWTGKTQMAAQAPLGSTARASVIPVPAGPEIASTPATETVAAKPSAPRKSAQQDATHDPDELWKQVRRGSADAEVELAMMYLNGRQVSQNCEQAHLLLLAAAKKQNTKSTDLLSRVYSQRCR